MVRSFRRFYAGALALLLAACSGNVSTLPGSQLSPNRVAPSGSHQKLRTTLRIHIPRHRRHRERGHYISPSTKGITITFSGPTPITSKTMGLTPSSPGCSSGTNGTTCILHFSLAACPTSANCYIGTVTTYDNVSCTTSCTIPNGSNALSANQSVAFSIGKGLANSINLTLGGIPATVGIVPAVSSTLIGNNASGYAISKCVTAPQHVTVAGFDADSNQIVGPGALASATLTSDDTVHLAVTTPAPSASPDAFALVPPATLVAATIPKANTVVHLTAGITPLSDSGATAPPNAHTTVTFNTDICGVVTEFPVPTSSSVPFEIVAGPDGNLWFTEACSGTLSNPGKVGKITTTGSITEYTTNGLYPTYITVGPDNNLWFTETNPPTRSLDKVGKISTNGGAVTDYSTSSSNFTGIAGISFGADANLWFTECSKNYVDTMTTSGSGFTQYNTGLTSGSQPAATVKGPDGRVWFTERNAVKIGKIDTSGTISEYGGLSGAPGDITVGTDGSLWFTEGVVDKIGTMTTTGSLTEYSNGITGSSTPAAIATGPDGAMWFVENNADIIGRVTTTGTIKEFSIHPGNPTISAYPGDLTTGPDGAIWFTECTGNAIGRMQ